MMFFSIAPPFHLGFLALFYRFFKRTPIVYHIQDLQIEAAKELNMLPSPLFSMLFSMERFILNSVNIVTTISEGMKRKIVKKTKRNVTLFPNWVDTFEFHPVVGRNELKLRWGFLPNDKIVLYSGSIGEKQGLDALIRIAHELKSYSDIKFIICGTGPFKNNLVQLTADLMLQNVHFLPLQGKDVFNDFLNIGDIHIVLQKADASDLVMPSKLTTILSIGGLALITANLGTTLCDVVLTHQMGVVVIPEDENVLKEAILKCCNGDFSLERANARKYAETNLNKDNILTKMVNNI
ncbi:glycosyltransferase [Pedobacter sp. P26]|uniref:glycosyltransferase n=1 Tax=Pedobacter sp. P26 TaxID=3423956 RepID=UPI003D666BC3